MFCGRATCSAAGPRLQGNRVPVGLRGCQAGAAEGLGGPEQQRHQGHNGLLRAIAGLCGRQDPVLGSEEVYQSESRDWLCHEIVCEVVVTAGQPPAAVAGRCQLLATTGHTSLAKRTAGSNCQPPSVSRGQPCVDHQPPMLPLPQSITLPAVPQDCCGTGGS